LQKIPYRRSINKIQKIKDMKSREKIKLGEEMLKATIVYYLKQIDYLLDLKINHIYVWSTQSNEGVFHATQIISMFISVGFTCYIEYDDFNARCELVIF